mmetsp:Transcript_82673/g.165239  ORF Transcript_82673/g.165239 Transcript_82673/m.165239 type:complete len:270 (-) Transcript_82673:1146-1955(-)
MVRQPGDHGVVGRPVAERRVCFVDAVLCAAQPVPRLGHVDFVHRRRPGHSDALRRAADQPPDPGAHQAGGRSGGSLRRHLVLQRSLRGAHASPRARRRRVPTRAAAVHGAPPVREHGDVPPVAGVGGGLQQAHCADHGVVDGADGVSPRGSGEAHAQRGRQEHGPVLEAVVVLGRRQRHRWPHLDDSLDGGHFRHAGGAGHRDLDGGPHDGADGAPGVGWRGVGQAQCGAARANARGLRRRCEPCQGRVFHGAGPRGPHWFAAGRLRPG